VILRLSSLFEEGRLFCHASMRQAEKEFPLDKPIGICYNEQDG